MKQLLIRIYGALLDLKDSVINDVICRRAKTPNVGSFEETVEMIIDENASMSRFGDGEFSLIRGTNLKFQQHDDALAEELGRILQLSAAERKDFLVCIPNVFGSLDQYADKAAGYWRRYLHKNRKNIYNLLRFDVKYFDALITRFYVDYADKSQMDEKVHLLRKIWQDKRLLIVEGEKSRLGMGNDLFSNASSIRRIVCPSANAYSRIDAIEHAVADVRDFDMVLIALGPTASVLAYRLHKKGVHALDIGHIDIEYEWYRKGVLEKEPIQHKYIGEMPGGDIVDDITDENYDLQIIRRIL